jgi:CheY-like chemotaxis protein
MEERNKPRILFVGRDRELRQAYEEEAQAARGGSFDFANADPRDAVIGGLPGATIHVAGPRAGEGDSILLVDDEASMCLDLAHALEEDFGRAYDIETATDAKRGLAILGELEARGRKVALLSTCYNMPGMNGPEFLERAKKGRPGLATILVSGGCEATEVLGLFSRAILDAQLPKPFDADVLRFVAGFLLAPPGMPGPGRGGF